MCSCAMLLLYTRIRGTAWCPVCGFGSLGFHCDRAGFPNPSQAVLSSLRCEPLHGAFSCVQWTAGFVVAFFMAMVPLWLVCSTRYAGELV